MSRSRSSSITAVTASGKAVRGVLSRTSSKQNLATEAPKNLGSRMSASVIGVKGSLLKEGSTMQEVEENPMARLKLLLVRAFSFRCFFEANPCFQIASFLTLHILNFCTTLTPATTNARHQRHPLRPIETVLTPVVDITSPAIMQVLSTLGATEIMPTGADISKPVEVVVKIAPPVYVHAIPIAAPTQAGTGEAIEKFMSSWSSLVGDPVVSKWIVALLAVSVALNGYLLKGIAAGSGLAAMRAVRSQGVRFRSRARSVVKLAEEHEEEERHRPAPVFVMASAAPIVAAPVVPIKEPEPAPAPAPQPPSSVLSRPLNLDSVDRKLKDTLPIRSPAPVEPITPQTPDAEASQVEVRSLAECVDIFENGPRPVSVALQTLNDEEVILLSQTGKIAAYALEKMLGDYDRAVRIRRALICEFDRID